MGPKRDPGFVAGSGGGPRTALKRYGFVCWCPTCHGVLNEQPCDWDYVRLEHVYSCDCGTTSWWNFDFPTPLLSGSES